MLTGKKIILFGAGLYGQMALRYFGMRNVHCFVDNKKHGQFYLGKHVISFDELKRIHEQYDVVISVGSFAYPPIKAACVQAGIRACSLFEMLDVNDFESDPALAQFKDKHKGERCFLIGNGPSLKPDDLEKIHINDDVAFGCNHIYSVFPRTNWRPDYYFATDPMFIKYIGDVLPHIASSIKFIRNLSMDSSSTGTHLSAEDPSLYTTNSLINIDLATPTNFSSDPSRASFNGYTVMYSMIQWAAYMGFKDIYLLGVDCTPVSLDLVGKRHFYKNNADELRNEIAGIRSTIETFGAKEYIDTWINDYTVAEQYSREHGFRIYNATRGGYLEVFERVDFDSLF